MVTPPVALAAYTAAAIAKADVMHAALAAFRFSLVGFALPYAFVLRPELVMLTVENEPASAIMIGINVLLTLVAIIGLAAGIAGFAFKRLTVVWQVMLLVSSLSIFFTRLQGWQLAVQITAALWILSTLLINLARSRKTH